MIYGLVFSVSRIKYDIIEVSLNDVSFSCPPPPPPLSLSVYLDVVTTHRDVFQPLNRDIHANFPWHGLRNGTLTAITTSDIEYRNAVPPFCSLVYHEGIELRPHTEFLEKLYVLLTGVAWISRTITA